MANQAGGDVFNREQAEKLLYPAKGLAGGGQLEVRMEVSPDHPDPDIRGVARRVKFFNLESWHSEWTEVAKKNEELAAAFEQESRKQTAHEFYLRAADFYRRAVVYMAESDPRMLPTFKKLEDNFNRAWSVVSLPFERVEILYEGHKLPALFWLGRGKPGAKLPVVYNYGGADGILLRGEDGGAGQYVRRGMSFIDVDGPGHGGTLRYHKLYAPADSERVAKPWSIISSLVPTSMPSASVCMGPAWAATQGRAAPQRKNALKPSPYGAARTISSTISSTTSRRFKNVYVGLSAPETSKMPVRRSRSSLSSAEPARSNARCSSATASTIASWTRAALSTSTKTP